jgi:hypothetical protein
VLAFNFYFTSPGLDPGAHVFVLERCGFKTWMAGSSPAKARIELVQFDRITD